ncbi:secreted RxLR effector protein 161-like [Malania oleifera]|uniref:secreted RxLR effector protein 161-like n=1 Tax=Malania oleifera TaxID=397392 RepID=UPI0025AE654D|nr:secreted RxLR effector protein 161-like [Malania oleifera]
MKDVPYAFVVGSLMYAQTCTKPDISFAIGMLSRYQSNPEMIHLKVAKKVLRYLQGTKDYKLMYRRSDLFEVVGYSDSDFAGSFVDDSIAECYDISNAESSIKYCDSYVIDALDDSQVEYWNISCNESSNYPSDNYAISSYNNPCDACCDDSYAKS